MERGARFILSLLVTSAVCAFITAPAWPRGGAIAMSVEQIRHDLAHGRTSAEHLTQEALARIDRYEPIYNAMTTMNVNALAEARAEDRRRLDGKAPGRLAGVPIVIKEAVDVAGMPSTMGWARLHPALGGIELIPARDAPVVRRLREAGAIILGKTNIPAFSADDTRTDSSWAGPTLNALNPLLAPGASSSGSATAVAAGFAVAGIAEETAGSIQNPAAAQALVGVKPTFGLVPNVGVAPLAGSTRDVVGVVARSVRDAAIMLSTIAGYTYEDPKTVAAVGHVPAKGYESFLSVTALRGKRIGLYGPGWRAERPSRETETLYRRAVAQLEALGAEVVTDPFQGTRFAKLAKLDGGIFDSRGLETVIQDFDAYFARLGPSSPFHSYRELVARTGADPMSPGQPLHFFADIVKARTSGPDAEPDVDAFAKAREEYLAVFQDVVDRHRIDAFVFPQMLSEVPRLKGEGSYKAATVPELNIAGLPGVVVPAGAYRSGSPFSLIFVGPQWSEARLLALAFSFEQGSAPGLRPMSLEGADEHVVQQKRHR